MAYDEKKGGAGTKPVCKPTASGGATPQPYIGGLQSAVIKDKKVC